MASKSKINNIKTNTQQKRGSASCPTGVYKPLSLNFCICLLLSLFTSITYSSEVSETVSKGNKLYKEGNYTAAADSYQNAAELDPGLEEAKFNKGNCEYRLNEIDKAIDAYKEAAARSKDDKIIAKAKYNLGNSYYQRAKLAEQAKQAPPAAGEETLLQSADPMNDYRSAVKSWRQVLDIDPENPNAKRNIEVSKRQIQKLKEQQQQQQNQDQQDKQQDQQKKNDQNDDKNKQDQQNQQDKQDDQNDKQDQSKDDQQKDDQKQQDQQDKQDETDQQKQQPKPDEQPPKDARDELADEILKKEKQDKKERRIMMLRQIPVEKDW